MREPVFLALDQVRALHRIALEQYGGQDGLRDLSGLESAVMHPQNVWFYGQGDEFDVAAAYAFHLAEAQAFLDGNKRTGIGSALTFLRLNGKVVMRHTEELHEAMIAISDRRLDKPRLGIFVTLTLP